MISPFLTRPINLPRQAPVSDPQRERLYKLEREIMGSSVYHVVSRSNLKVLADHVCRYYRIAAIKITVVNQPKVRELGWCISYSYDGGAPFGFSIYLNRGFHGANATVLMHELAHYIVDTTYMNHESHGKEFAGVYMHLLAKYRVLPSACFRLLAKKWRIKIAARFKPGAIRG